MKEVSFNQCESLMVPHAREIALLDTRWVIVSEAIDAYHTIALMYEPLRQMGANEAGNTCD